MVNVPVNRDAMMAFLFRARRATTQAHDQNARASAAVVAMRQVEYSEGDLLYRDSAYGFTFFAGESAVYYRDTLLWNMTYTRGVFDEFADSPALHRFLQEALMRVTEERPFRGPENYQRGACVYTNTITGDVAGFYGVETVLLNGRRVYDLHYNGGLVRLI